jgi:hypothetical protein
MPATTTTFAKVSFYNLLYIPCVPFLTYLSIPVEPIFILAVLLGMDYFTGILKVFVLKGHLRSYRAVAGILAKASIVMLVLALAFMAKGVGLDFKLYLSFLISALIISETYSIIGNTYSIVSKEEIEEFDAVAMVLKRLRFFIEKMLIVNRDKS